MIKILEPKKQCRNELCACGSGIKHKKCCGQQLNKDLTLRDMMKCLYLLLEGASQQNLALRKGPIPFSKKMLADVPENLVNEIMVADDPKFLVLTVKKRERPLIVIPSMKQIDKISRG